jgi:hypothetical protein
MTNDSKPSRPDAADMKTSHGRISRGPRNGDFPPCQRSRKNFRDRSETIRLRLPALLDVSCLERCAKHIHARCHGSIAIDVAFCVVDAA